MKKEIYAVNLSFEMETINTENVNIFDDYFQCSDERQADISDGLMNFIKKYVSEQDEEELYPVDYFERAEEFHNILDAMSEEGFI